MNRSAGFLYGFRNWIEYSFKQAKNELGWADFRVTDYSQIEKWWEVVMSAYLMVSLQAQKREPTVPSEETDGFSSTEPVEPDILSQHAWWDFNRGWKSTLNNLRLVVQPLIFFNLIVRIQVGVVDIGYIDARAYFYDRASATSSKR